MGIQGLMKLLTEEAPGAIKEVDMESLTGRKVAIDASMAIYQFLIAVRSMGQGGNQAAAMLTNEAGDVTSHIQGMFSRTIKMMAAGCKPVYVFDGKPPDMKGGTLAKRSANRLKAEEELTAAKENDDIELINKFSTRLVKVGKKENDECKHLLRLMGVPVVEAPCEAEAQCAELAKEGKVYATATEDMDALTFRTPKLLRKMTFAAGQKQPIIEIDIAAVLSGLDLPYESFIDLCIMMGCDYCNTIKGVGPKTALILIRQHKCLENVVKALLKNPKTKANVPPEYLQQRVRRDEVAEVVAERLSSSEKALSIEDEEEANGDIPPEEELQIADVVVDDVDPEDVKEEEKDVEAGDDDEYEIIEPVYVHARKLFFSPNILPAGTIELKWTEPDEAALREFLVEKMGFQLERVNNGIKKLQEAQKKKSQGRMDSFFASAGTVTSSAGLKRKAEAPVKGKGLATGKGAKAGSSFGKKR